jgi:hypothetical protein
MFCGRKLFQHIVTRLNMIYLTKMTEIDLNKTEKNTWKKQKHNTIDNSIMIRQSLDSFRFLQYYQTKKTNMSHLITLDFKKISNVNMPCMQ